MPLIRPDQTASFERPGMRVTGLAAPSRGARETAVWLVALEPGTPGLPHAVTREEIFVTLEGEAVAVVGEEEHRLVPGSALVVPAHTRFTLSNPFAAPFRAVAALPTGGQAVVDGTPAFAPPWAL